MYNLEQDTAAQHDVKDTRRHFRKSGGLLYTSVYPSGQERPFSVSAWIAILFLVAAVVTLLITQDTGMVAGMSTETFVQLTAGLAVLVFLSGMLGASYRGRLVQAVKHLVSWAAVVLVLVG